MQMDGMYGFERDVEKYCKENKLITPGMKVAVGVSGGADSVGLLLVLSRLSLKCEFEVAAVHVEHGIRGQESLEDAEFVQSLALALKIPVFIRSVDAEMYSREKHLTLEEAARELRYQVFYEEAEAMGADRIAVAHNLEDQAETVLMNILRGSGLKGLEGMRPLRDRIIRPFLQISRKQIEAYLKAAGQEWRTDRTNACLDYTRNKIRLEIMPTLVREINAQSVGHLAQLAKTARQAQDHLQEEAREILSLAASVKIREDGTKEISFPVAELKSRSPLLQEYVVRSAIEGLADGRGLKDVGRVHITDICGLLKKGSGKRLDLPGGLKARRQGRDLLLYREKV